MYICTLKKLDSMKKSNISKIILGALALMTAASCTEKKFHVEGSITEAKDSVLYFENIGLEGIEKLDSTKLGESGAFSFSGEAKGAPEFYRLRIDDQIISLAVDSTETITVKASYPTMVSEYEIEGNDNNKTIKELVLKQMDLTKRAMAVQQDETMDIDATNDSILNMIASYKEYLKKNYIFKEPHKASSYFALFQTLGNMLIFNPKSNTDDIKAFAAVATSWDTFYPGSLRGENLHNIAIEGLKNTRVARGNSGKTIEADKVEVSGIIDVPLTDNHGKERSMKELKDKVILLDFHVFASSGSTERIMALRDLYNKYHAQGLEIYQVSLDSDEHFWKTQTAALPWICVRDADGANSRFLTLYNVQSIPTFFLIKRGNELYKRDAQMSDVEKEIKSLL